MNAKPPTGLGEPEPSGKLSLFQPPRKPQKPRVNKIKKTKPKQKPTPKLLRRIHTTLDLTWEALQVIQEIQRAHRLRTGKVLPQWKAVSRAIMGYSQMKFQTKTGPSGTNPA